MWNYNSCKRVYDLCRLVIAFHAGNVHLKSGGDIISKAHFEAGIKLGALFHQFIGVPISFENVELLEKAMESCIKLQPFVVDAKVRIDRNKLREKISSFGYTSLDAEMLSAEVTVRVEGKEVKAVLRWDEILRYPIMEVVHEDRR